mmetsp:Transcript_52873/g.132905  ORF Transcript_52873/g.132905 Transcript_52873/m.132905 type:complete len:266 (+) Transcript_52873:1595-2392(+)
MGSNNISSTRAICPGLRVSSIHTHCRQATRTVTPSFFSLSSKTVTSSGTANAKSELLTIFNRAVCVVTAIRLISSSLSSTQCNTPSRRAGYRGCREIEAPISTKSWSHTNAVRRQKFSAALHPLTTIFATSPITLSASLGPDCLISFRNSDRQASAPCRISLFVSASMLKRPSRNCGRYDNISTSGTESRMVIQLNISCLTYGFSTRIRCDNSEMNSATLKAGHSVTMSLMSLSRYCAPFFTSTSTSAKSLHSPSNMSLKYLRTS